MAWSVPEIIIFHSLLRVHMQTPLPFQLARAEMQSASVEKFYCLLSENVLLYHVFGPSVMWALQADQVATKIIVGLIEAHALHNCSICVFTFSF